MYSARQESESKSKTHLDVVDLERLRVSQRRSQCSVLGASRAHQELEFVKSKLNPGLELVLWSYGSTKVETIPNCKDGFELEILAPVKILNQTQTVGVDVAPSAFSARSVLQRTNCLVPLPEVWRKAPLKVVTCFLSAYPTLNTCHMLKLTSRESQELSVQSLQCLGKIHTKTIGSVLVGRREKTDQVEVKRATRDTRLVESKVERVVRVWCCRGRGEGEVVLNPHIGRGLRLNLCGSESLVVDVRLQGSGEFALVSSLDPEGASVVLNLDTNAPVSTVVVSMDVLVVWTRQPYVFENPTSASVALLVATFIEVGRALESG